MRLNLVHVDEPRGCPAVLVDRLEDVGDGSLMLGRLQQALEGAERSRVAGVVGQHVAVDFDGGIGRPHALFSNLRQTKEEHRLLVWVVVHRQLALDVVDEVAPQALSSQQVVERAQRAPVGRIELENLVLQRDRLVGFVQQLGMRASHLGEDADFVVGIRVRLGASPKDTHELVPTLRASVERIERAEHLEVPGIHFEHLAVRRNGGLHVLELRFMNLRSLDPERAAQAKHLRRSRRDHP